MTRQYITKLFLIIPFLIAGSASGQNLESELILQIAQRIQTESSVHNKKNDSVDHGTCRNTQILSYRPDAGSTLSELNDVFFVASQDTFVPSLEATINKQSLPVEYKSQEDGTYAVRVRVPDHISGHWYVSLGAQSTKPGACNDTLMTSFGKTNNTDIPAYSNEIVNTPIVNNYVENKQKDSTTQTNNNDHSSVESIAVVKLSNDSDNKVEIVAAEVTQVVLEGTEDSGSVFDSVTELSQGAFLIGGLSAVWSDQECITFGSSWSWYVWMFVLGIYLIVIWFAVLMFVEPYMGRAVYKKRLISAVGAGTAAMIVLWYCANPCLTHIWIPSAICIIGVIVYWLYSEEPVAVVTQDNLANNYVDSHYDRKDHYPKKKKKKNQHR